MSKFRSPRPRNSVMLLPPSIEEYVADDDIVRYVDTLVDEFDLSEIERQYSEEGRPGFSPRVLTKIIIFGKMRGIRTCRGLAQACRENLRFMFLAQEERPDFRTIGLFRKRFEEPLAGLLKQTVGIGVREGLITLDKVALDGTKLSASAHRSSFHKAGELEGKIAKLEEELATSLKEDIAGDESDIASSSVSVDEPKLPEKFRKKEALRDQLKKALEYSKAEGLSRTTPVSTTDQDSRWIQGPRGTSGPSYNCQAAIDGDSGCFVAGYVTNEAVDSGELMPLVNQTEENAGKEVEKVVTDKGYCAYAGIEELHDQGTVGYIPLPRRGPTGYSWMDFNYDRENDEFRCVANRILIRNRTRDEAGRVGYRALDCSGCPHASKCITGKDTTHRTVQVPKRIEIYQEMVQRVASPEGKARARFRKTSIEPAFGTIKAARGVRAFLVRGKRAVNAAWMIELVAHNVRNIGLFR
jgi:transposase